MRTLFILTLTMMAGLAGGVQSHDELLPHAKSPSDLTTPEALTENLADDAAHLAWPPTILKKEIGAQRDGGRMCLFAIFQMGELNRRDCSTVVIKSVGIFANTMADGGMMHQVCITMKCPGHTARLFVPIEALRKLSQEMDESAQFSMAQKKELVKACDWRELDAICDECERMKMPSAAVLHRTPEPTLNVLPRMLLKESQQVDVASIDELGDCYLIQDEAGRFMRLKKKDVLAILPPDPRAGR
jgi:hypothetical protein